MPLKIILSVLFLSVLLSCSNNESVRHQPEPIIRLDRFAAQYPDVDSIQSIEMQQAVDVLLSVLNSRRTEHVGFDEYSKSDAVKIFQPDIEKYLLSLDSVSVSLGSVRDNLAKLLPEVRWRKLYGIVTPYRQSVVTADSITLIGLNHYLGSDYAGYGSFETYLRTFKTPARMPVDIAEATIASDYPFLPSEEPVVLERMLYEGALVYALTQVVPETDAAKILGYSPAQWQWAIENESEAWSALATRQLLYSTDQSVSAKLNNLSPATTILNQDAPGMLGRFIGYRIVCDYVKNNRTVDLSFLLSPSFYNSRASLVNSGYSPTHR